MPYWRLSTFYFFYFASLGIVIPYWALYLKSLDFSPLEIGELMALLMATKIISPNIWGWIADHTGKRMQVVRLGSLLALISFVGVFFSQSYFSIALVMLLYSFFWNATLPQFEAITFNYLNHDTHRYSMIRLWGSVGFIVAAVLLGPLLEIYSVTIVPQMALVAFVAIVIASWVVPSCNEAVHHHEHTPIMQVLKRPEVIALFVVCILIQASHGPYYAFYTLYMEAHNYSRSTIGQLWALGVFVEVCAFLIMHRMIKSFGLYALLITTLVLTALRWLLIALFPEQFMTMLFAQSLHAVSFGVYHAVSITFIHHIFKGKLQGRGQALYSSLSFGFGGAIGSYVAGVMWDTINPMSAYLMSSILCVLALIISPIWLKRLSERVYPNFLKE